MECAEISGAGYIIHACLRVLTVLVHVAGGDLWTDANRRLG